MKTLILILAIAGSVLCQRGGWNSGFGGHESQEGHRGSFSPWRRGSQPPPYLQGLTEEAHIQFFGIIFNKSLTIAQQKQEIHKWAEKYRILGKVQAFDKKREERINAMKANVMKLIHELPVAMQKHSALMDNDSQTLMERRASVVRLHSENPQLYRVLAFAVKQFLPRQPPHSLPGAPGGLSGAPGFPEGQGGFPGGEGGFPGGQGGFPGEQGGLPGGDRGCPWGCGVFPEGNGGFPGGQGFPGGEGGFPGGQGGFPGEQGGLPGGDRGCPWGCGGFPEGNGGFPWGQGGFPGGQGGFPGRPGGFPGGYGGFPGGRGGFPRRHEDFGRFGNGQHGFNGDPQFPGNQGWRGMNDGRFPHHGRVRV
ncbi:hypothetical protein ANCCAN_13170 [Ancylostoma caninum]|uniref:SXP/RAL-2 family protein Ani s 5-like cation-binding domain-containing protein n=1 Tax=Ancylostoma caninum TaxID=29170 RepID=A0A368G914_ANCCA|nr:hypothetical protein ANCCAN_13170 [Ancylostoma caninum]